MRCVLAAVALALLLGGALSLGLSAPAAAGFKVGAGFGDEECC
jgi:Spy/CpxP family protein refolding chaperone